MTSCSTASPTGAEPETTSPEPWSEFRNSASSDASVTVVVPAYRAERTIRRMVSSVLADPSVATVIVVIDGNFDGTERALAGTPAHVQIVARQDNWGASRTRNQGLDLVQTPFVMFVDADDFIEGPLISGLVRAMKEADVGFGPMVVLYEATGLRAPRFVPAYRSGADAFRRWHLDGVYVNPTSVMWRTQFIREIGGWDPTITRNDDGELVMRALLCGARVATSDQGQGVYVQHSSETLNHRTDIMESMLRVNEKLLSMKTFVVSPEEQRSVCAGHAFDIAWHAYLAGRDDVGDQALGRARELGFTGTRGPLPYHMLQRLLGVRCAGKLGRVLKALRRP